MAYVKYIFDYVNHSIHSFCNLYTSGSVLSARDMRANSRYSSTHRELSKFSTTFAVKDFPGGSVVKTRLPVWGMQV